MTFFYLKKQIDQPNFTITFFFFNHLLVSFNTFFIFTQFRPPAAEPGPGAAYPLTSIIGPDFM